MSVPPPSRLSRPASAACSTMNRLAPLRCARPASWPCRPAGMTSGTMAAAVARHRRPRPVGRQLDLLRQAVERRLPERQLPRDGAGLRRSPRPAPRAATGVVGVLHRQRRKRRGQRRRGGPGTMPRDRATADRATSRRRRCDAAGPAAPAGPARPRRGPARTDAPAAASRATDRSPARPQPSAPPQAPPRHRRRPRSAAPAAPAAARARPAAARRAGPATMVRRLSCRSTRSPSAACSASRSSAPVSRTASGIT